MKNDCQDIIYMQLQIVTYPNKKVLSKDFPDDSTVDDVLKDITGETGVNTDGMSLIVDKSSLFMRIPEDDETNRYYNGQLGEIYRILDGSARHLADDTTDVTRYRMVMRPVPTTKEKSKHRYNKVTPELYTSAHETLLTMLKDRGCDATEVDKYAMDLVQMRQEYDNLGSYTVPSVYDDSPPLINHRGKCVYAAYLSPDNEIMTTRKAGPFCREFVVPLANSAITHYNKVVAVSEDDQLESIDQKELLDSRNENMIRFTERIELILVFNNAYCATVLKTGIPHKCLQAFSVQSLSFNITQHVYQSKFTLLNLDTHRDELRDIYALNGRILDPRKTLKSYHLRSSAKLVLL